MSFEEINNNNKNLDNFESTNGIIIDSVSKNEVKAHIDITKRSLNPWGMVHGGLIFGIADEVIGMLCYMNGYKAVTIDANINYLKPCRGNIKAVSQIIKMGRTVSVLEAKIYNEKDELAAIATMNYFNIDTTEKNISTMY